jgi:hypothetical protein
MQDATIGTAHVLYVVGFKIWLSVVFKCLRNLKKSGFFSQWQDPFAATKNGGVCPRRLDLIASVRRF